MAHDPKALKLIAPGAALGSGAGSVKNIYHYATNAADTVVEADDYFDGAVGNGLSVGDLILASLDLDGTPEVKVYVVSVGGADVTITAMLIA